MSSANVCIWEAYAQTRALTHRRSSVAALNGAGAAAAIAARLDIDRGGSRKEGHGGDCENERAREHHDAVV